MDVEFGNFRNKSYMWTHNSLWLIIPASTLYVCEWIRVRKLAFFDGKEGVQISTGGFEWVRSNPHLDLQKNINKPLNCTFLVSYRLKVVFTAIEKVTAVQTCLHGCSYASSFTGDQRRTLARKYVGQAFEWPSSDQSPHLHAVLVHGGAIYAKYNSTMAFSGTIHFTNNGGKRSTNGGGVYMDLKSTFSILPNTTMFWENNHATIGGAICSIFSLWISTQ